MIGIAAAVVLRANDGVELVTSDPGDLEPMVVATGQQGHRCGRGGRRALRSQLVRLRSAVNGPRRHDQPNWNENSECE